MTKCYQWKILYFFKSRNTRSIKFFFCVRNHSQYWLASLWYSLFAYLTFICLYPFIGKLIISSTWKMFQWLNSYWANNFVKFSCTIKTYVCWWSQLIITLLKQRNFTYNCLLKDTKGSFISVAFLQSVSIDHINHITKKLTVIHKGPLI